MIKKLVLQSVAVFVVAWLMDSVSLNPWYVAVVVAVVLGLINALIRPLVTLVTLPINFFTLGLFSLVINAAMVLLCDYLVEGFSTNGFLSAMLFSVILAVVSWGINLIFGDD